MPISKVYYFPVNEQGQEGKPVAIELDVQGKADLSSLPDEVRDHLETFGVEDSTKTESLFPKDGEVFLEALLYATNQGWRFRLTA